MSLAAALTLAACGGASAKTAAAAAFCATWRHSRAHPGQIFAGLGAAPAFSDSTPTAAILPAMERIAGLYGRLDAQAPSPVKPAMGRAERRQDGEPGGG